MAGSCLQRGYPQAIGSSGENESVPMRSISNTLLLAVSAAALSDGAEMPMFDVDPFCRGTEQVQSCLAEEETAREFLVSNWNSFPPNDRRRCVAQSVDPKATCKNK